MKEYVDPHSNHSNAHQSAQLEAEVKQEEYMKKNEKQVDLPALLEKQYRAFFDEQKKRAMAQHTEHARGLWEKNFTWVDIFARKYLETRLVRGQEIESQDVEDARNISKEFYGADENYHILITCLDGRNMATIMLLKPPHINRTIRTPAGEIEAIMDGAKPGTVFIDVNSAILNGIAKIFKTENDKTVFVILDSHFHCAARKGKKGTEGVAEEEWGLRSDVLSKTIVCQGLLEVRSNLVANGEDVAKVVPVFISYDPGNGGLVMGLETHLDEEEVVNKGFTHEIIDHLAEEKKIIRTMDLLQDKKVQDLLHEAIEPASLDFRNRYPQSLKKAWQAIAKIYDKGNGKLYQYLVAELFTAYTNSGWVVAEEDGFKDKKISHKALRQKAKTVTQNLVARYSIAGVDGPWPYGEHQEDLLRVAQSEYAPFSSLDNFSISAQDLDDLLANVELGIGLIRTFRHDGRVTDKYPEIGLTKEEFTAAPITFANEAAMKEKIDEDFWKTMGEVNWFQIFSKINWDNPGVYKWRKDNISNRVSGALKGKDVKVDAHAFATFIDLVWELFHKMQLMMENKDLRKMICRGNLLVLNSIVDFDQKPRVILPFVV